MITQKHTEARSRLLNCFAVATVFMGAVMTSGCESLLVGTDLGLDSAGGVNVGVNVGSSLGYGSWNWPYTQYGPATLPPPPPPAVRPVPVVVNPVPPVRPAVNPRPIPGNWLPGQNGGITLRPAPLPGSRPPVINQGGEPGPVIPAGQLRPGGNMRQ